MNRIKKKKNPVAIVILSCPNNIKKVHARPSCHLQTFCHILSQQGSIFAMVPMRQLHMLPFLLVPCTKGMAKIIPQCYYCCPPGEVSAMKWFWSPVKAYMVIFLLAEKATGSFTTGDRGYDNLPFILVGVGWVFGCLMPLQHFCGLINPQKACNYLSVSLWTS